MVGTRLGLGERLGMERTRRRMGLVGSSSNDIRSSF